MKRKNIFVLCILVLLIPLSISSIIAKGGTEHNVKCYSSNPKGVTQLFEKTVSYEELNELEKHLNALFSNHIEDEMDTIRERVLEILQNANIFPENFDYRQFLPSFCKKEWGWGIFNYIISYGNGEIYIPLRSDRSFLKIILRPIFFNYGYGITLTKLGATYIWDKDCTVGNIGLMLGRQRGFMIGFIGLHIRIPHNLVPDSHLFLGAAISINGNNLLF